MAIKIINSEIILFVIYMGLKQGWAMLSGKPEMITLFGKWNFNKEGIRLFGAITLLSAVLLLFPATFIWGNFLMASTILLIICLQLSVKNIKGVAIEIPFFLLNLLIIYLQYPFSKLSE